MSLFYLPGILTAEAVSADGTAMDDEKENDMENFINNAPFALVLVFLVIGFVLLIKGADFFVEGSSSVAKRLHVPAIIIGLPLWQWEHRFRKQRSVYRPRSQATMNLR